MIAAAAGAGRRARAAAPRRSRPASPSTCPTSASRRAGRRRTFLAEQAREHGVWVGGSCPEIPRRRAGRRPAAVQQLRARRSRRHGAPLPQDPPVHLRRRGEALPRRRPSSSPSTIEGLRVSLFVCYDLRFADEFWQLARDTDVYLVPANWPAKRRLHWQALLQARAIENQAYVVGVNRVGDGRRPRLQRRQPHRRPARRAAGHRRAHRDASCSPTSPPPTSPRPATTSASSRTAADAVRSGG